MPRRTQVKKKKKGLRRYKWLGGKWKQCWLSRPVEDHTSKHNTSGQATFTRRSNSHTFCRANKPRLTNSCTSVSNLAYVMSCLCYSVSSPLTYMLVCISIVTPLLQAAMLVEFQPERGEWTVDACRLRATRSWVCVCVCVCPPPPHTHTPFVSRINSWSDQRAHDLFTNRLLWHPQGSNPDVEMETHTWPQ